MLGSYIPIETNSDIKQNVKVCQVNISQFVNSMADSSFGERLKVAFRGAKNYEIARKMGVSDAAVKNYVDGRVPNAEILLLIRRLTGCNLDWLLSGEGSRFVGDDKEFNIERSIEMHDDWSQVLKDWYEYEGGEMPEDVGVSFMGGWRGFTKEQKIDAVKDLKKLLDRTIDQR